MSAIKKGMPYVRLGNSGLKVSKIILGCMSYGSPEWRNWVLGEEEGIEYIKIAYDAGIQTFDTANMYSNGVSEIVLGKAIKQHNLPRDEIVVMTKLCHPVSRIVSESVYQDADELGYVNQHGLSRKHIFEGVKASLERLQLDYVDVLQCHRFDYETPIEETMQALHDVVKAGYVRYIGMSSCHAWQFHIMQNYAITHNLTPFISVQNHYSLLYREEEREMMPTLKHFGVGSIPWSPLARGLLTRPVGEQTKRGENDPWINLYFNDRSDSEIISRYVSRDHVLVGDDSTYRSRFCFNTAPVVGTTSTQNLLDLLEAVKIQLTPEEVKQLEEPYTPRPVVGHF